MSDPATPPPIPHLSPKDRFLSREDDSNAWRKVARSDLFLNALTYSLSEFSLSNEPSTEQIKAVRGFIDTLLNIAEPKTPPRAPFPDKRLTMPALIPEPEKKTEKK